MSSLVCQGVPVRIEIGPRDVTRGELVAVTRDDGERQTVPRSDAVVTVKVCLLHSTPYSTPSLLLASLSLSHTHTHTHTHARTYTYMCIYVQTKQSSGTVGWCP